MPKDEDDNVSPSTSALLFPDLLTRDELFTVLRYKFRRIGVNTNRIVELTDDELLEQFKKFAMPKPQRKGCFSRNSLNKLGSMKHPDDARQTSLDELKNSGSVCNSVSPANGRQITVCGKRCGLDSTEHPNAVKNARKHSPIRFP